MAHKSQMFALDALTLFCITMQSIAVASIISLKKGMNFNVWCTDELSESKGFPDGQALGS